MSGSGNISRRLRRLAEMNRDELFTRSQQEIGKRIDGMVSRLGWNFEAGVIRQDVTAPSRQFFLSQDEVPAVLSLLRERLPDQCEQIVRRAERICQHHFDLLGYEDLSYGPDIDWALDLVHKKRAPNNLFYKMRYLDFSECGDVKVTWELNRHQHFITLAKAYRLTGDERFASEIFAQWNDWHRKNPYPAGINWASSLEVAFRSLSWNWTLFLLGAAAEQRPGFHEQFLLAQAVNGRHIERYLSTYFSPNTHLLGEAVALFFLGTLYPELRFAERWQKRGWQIVLQEAQRQVRSDGMHFEQSVYYHVYALDFFLQARILAARNQIQIPSQLDKTIQQMLSGLCLLGRTGAPSRLGDDDGGRLFDGHRNRSEHMIDPLATGAVLYGRGDLKFVAGPLREETLWLLGGGVGDAFDRLPAEPPAQVSAALTESGLYLMEDAESGRRIVIDAGPLGSGSGGHGHADGLSICVSDRNGQVLIDPGTFEYVGDGPARDQYRGTSAHNTLTVDRLSQADPRGPFGWSNQPQGRAEVWISGHNFDLFMGSHNGYDRLHVVHRRWVFSLKSRFWLVRDVVEGQGSHQLDIYWHLASGFSQRGNTNVFVSADGNLLDALTASGEPWSRKVEQGNWSPAYGRTEPASVLHFGTVADLPSEFVTLFRAGTADMEPGELQMEKQSAASGYHYAMPEREHSIIFANSATHWTLSAWTSDADFLYWSADRHGESGDLIFCNGTYVNFHGQPVVSSPHRVGRCEITERHGKREVSVSDNGAVTVHCPSIGRFTEIEAVMPVNHAAGREPAGE